MRRFEYKIIGSEVWDLPELNKLGAAGWDLVIVHKPKHNLETVKAILKRELLKQVDYETP